MPLRIMIVEDEAVIALNLEGMLEDAGHVVVGIAARASSIKRESKVGEIG